MGVDRETQNPVKEDMKRGTKDVKGNRSGFNFNYGNGSNRSCLHEAENNYNRKMRGGKGSGAELRNPKKMSIIKKLVEKSIDAMAFLFTASIAAIAVIATIVLIGGIL